MFQTDYSVIDLSRNELEANINTSHPASVDIQLALYHILIPLLGILIIVLNGLIVISSGLILHRGQQPRSTYIFLGNVALSDMLIGVTVLFGQYYPISLRTTLICSTLIGMTVSSTISSVYSIGLIAIDRYLYILYGLQYQRYISSNRARIMCILTWMLGIIIGFLPAMGVRNETDNGRICWLVILLPPELIIVTTTIGIIPLIVIIVLYSIILKHALNKVAELKLAANNQRGYQNGELRVFRGGQQNHHQQHSRASIQSGIGDGIVESYREANTIETKTHAGNIWSRCCSRSNKKEITPKITPVYNPSKWKAIKIVLFTTGSFFVTWFPFFFTSALYAFCNTRTTPLYCDSLKIALASPLAILGLINSILNPLIYAWWHNGFRESVIKFYKGIIPDRFQSESSSTVENVQHGGQRATVTGAVTSGSEVDTSDIEQSRIIRPKKKQIHQNPDPPVAGEQSIVNHNTTGTDL